MPKKYTADAPEQQQYPSPSAIAGSPTVDLGAAEMQAMNAFDEQSQSVLASMQAMMEDMHAQHSRSLQLIEAKMQLMEKRIDQITLANDGEEALIGDAAAGSDEVEAKLTDGERTHAKETTAETTRMPTLVLGEYSGTKYDGSPDKFSQWDDSIRNKLTTHNMLACITDETFQGRDINGHRIKSGPFLNELISEASDRQSAIGAYITQSLTGTIATKISRLQKERDEKNAEAPTRPGTRITLSAFEIYAFVKKEATPELAFTTRGQVDKLFRQGKLAPRANRIAMDKYVEEKRSHWDYLNLTGGGEDVLSEHSLVAQILAGMEDHHEAARRVLENASQSPTGKYSLVLFQGAIDGQFPKDYSQETASTAYITTSLCEFCGKAGHDPAKCYRNPDQTCAECGKRGHHKKICKERLKKKAEAGEEKARKKDVETAYIELGKAKEAELLSKGKVLSVGGITPPAPYAPPVPQQPSYTTTITLPSGISVTVPKD